MIFSETSHKELMKERNFNFNFIGESDNFNTQPILYRDIQKGNIYQSPKKKIFINLQKISFTIDHFCDHSKLYGSLVTPPRIFFTLRIFYKFRQIQVEFWMSWVWSKFFSSKLKISYNKSKTEAAQSSKCIKAIIDDSTNLANVTDIGGTEPKLILLALLKQWNPCWYENLNKNEKYWNNFVLLRRGVTVRLISK